MNARFEGFYERLESCPDRLKTHRCLRWDEKKQKGFVWVGDIYEQNNVFFICFPRSTESLITKKTSCLSQVGMYFQRRNVVSPHDPGFFCTKMTINSKIK